MVKNKEPRCIYVNPEVYEKFRIYCILTHQKIGPTIEAWMDSLTKDLEMPRIKTRS